MAATKSATSCIGLAVLTGSTEEVPSLSSGVASAGELSRPFLVG